MTILVDTANLHHAVRKTFNTDKRLSYTKYIELIEEQFGPQRIKIAYAARPTPTADSFFNYLRNIGFDVRVKSPKSTTVNNTNFAYTNWNVEICVDAYTHASEHEPMIVGSCDIHLLPLLRDLKPKVKQLIIFTPFAPQIFSSCSEVILFNESLIYENDATE